MPESLLKIFFIKTESLAQGFSCEFCEISKNTFSYRTPPVAASETYSLIKSPWREKCLSSEIYTPL